MASYSVYLIRKKKNRIYKTDDILPQILENEGICGLKLIHSPSGAPVLVTDDASEASNRPSTGIPGNHETILTNQATILPDGCHTIFKNPASGETPSEPPHISVSDTKNFWACVLSETGDVGLDIEESARTIKDSVVKKLHPLEQQYLSELEPGSTEWATEFLNIWTRKEAYSKFCSAGLALGFKKFSVIDRVLEYSKTVTCQGRPEAVITQLNLPYDLTGALCTVPACLESTCKPAIPDVHVEILHCDGQPPIPALTAGANLLAARSVSTAELSAKLQKKGYTREESDAAAAELASRGYIDDSDYASRQAVLAARGGKSQSLIKRELAGKGLSGSDIDQAIEHLAEETEETEYDRALIQALRILPLPEEGEAKPGDKQLAKVARRLSSLGYGPGVIYSILDKYR